MTAEQEPPLFRELNQPRAFEQILGQLESAIASGQLRPGDRLPGERKLAETFGASRASVREALRVLEAFGVIVARRGAGPNAGSIVASGAQSGLQSALRLYVGLLQITTEDIIGVRAVLEGHAVALAAMRATPEEIGRLRQMVDAMAAAVEIDSYHDLDTAFHLELARLSGSTLLPVLMEALRASVRRAMIQAFAELDDWRAARDVLVEQHGQIVDRLEAQDAAAARAAVTDHVLGFYEDLVGDADRSDERPGRQARA